MTDKKEIDVFNGHKRIGSVHPSLDGLNWWASTEDRRALGPYRTQREAIDGIKFWRKRGGAR